MLALAATNVVGAVLFATLYAVGGKRLMSQGAFLACLVFVFGLMTALWVWVEARHRPLGFLARVGRIAAGVVIVALLVPTVVLMPLFWLDTNLPAEAGLNAMLAPMMTIVLIALMLVGVVNVVGSAVALVRGLAGARRRPSAG